MWNIKKANSSEEIAPASSSSRQQQMFMNPYELTKQELMRKLKFFGAYVAGIMVIPQLLRAVGLLEPIGIPLTRR